MRFRQLRLQDEHGHIPSDGLEKARQHVERMKAEQKRLAALRGKDASQIALAGISPGGWTWLGPGNVAGRVRDILIDPANPDSMWVGSASGGIWHTSNGGASWQPVDEFMKSLYISSLVMNPTNGDIMYAGTGEPSFLNITGLTDNGAGIFKSTNRGLTWAQLPATDPAADPMECPDSCPWFSVSRLAISLDGSTILAATSNGIRRSTDAGNSWTGVGPGLNYVNVQFDPNDAQKAIASSTTGDTVYSANGGLTWTDAMSSMTGHVEIAYAPSNSSIVYATADQNLGELYQSTNGGQSYSLINTGTKFFGEPYSPSQGAYDNVVWVDPLDPLVVMVGGVSLYRSQDGGLNFEAVGESNDLPHPDHHAITAHPGFNGSTNRIVYFGSDGGIYRWDDIAAEKTVGWNSLNHDLGITQFYGAAANPNGSVLLAGSQDNYTLKFAGDPESWTTTFKGDGGFTAVDPADPAFFYGEYAYLQIFRSTNGGQSADYIYCDPALIPNGGNAGACPNGGISDAANANGANFISPLLLDPGNTNTLLAGGVSLWRSLDVKNKQAPPTWTTIKSPSPLPNGNPNPISAIAAVSQSPGSVSTTLAVGHNDGRIYITTDGANWRLISNGTPARFVTRLVFDTTRSPAWLYATFGGFAPDNIYRTTDLGVTWTSVAGSGATALPSIPVLSFLIDPGNADYIYAGTEFGIFASANAGASWGVPQAGPTTAPVNDLLWASGINLVTFGRGIYRNSPTPVASICSTGSVFWDDPSSWLGGHVPGSTDDVNIRGACTMVIRLGGATCRNLTVAGDGVLFLQQGLSVFGDIVNDGTISGANGVTMAGSKSHDLYGGGSWIFGGIFSIPNGSVALANDMTLGVGTINIADGATFKSFDHTLIFTGGTFTNQGILDIGNGILDFRGTDSLQATIGFSSGKNPQLLGSGLVKLAPSDGLASFSSDGTFSPSVRVISGILDTDFTSIIGGTLQIDFGATLRLNSGVMTVTGNVDIEGTLTSKSFSSAPGFVFNGAALTNNGIVSNYGMRFNKTGAALSQTLGGTGVWGSGAAFTLGDNAGSVCILTLTNSISIGFTQLQISAGSTFVVGTNTLTFTGSSFIDSGSVAGNGVFILSPTGGTATVTPFGGVSIYPTLDIASGVVTENANFGGLTLNGDLKVDQNSTFTAQVAVKGSVKIDGALTNSFITFYGPGFSNKGTVASTYVSFVSFTGAAVVQSLSGQGTWSGNSGWISIAAPSTTTLLSDITYGGPILSVEGRLNTAGFTLTFPCGAVSRQGGGEIIGSIRYTSVPVCSGPIIFGSAFTTIQFTAGTLPTELTVTVALSLPSGFPNAIIRAYTITPLGGSATATVRLHYSDADLNGNSEGTLQLYRNDGASWNAVGATNRNSTQNWVEFAGVTQFSPWAISGPGGPIARKRSGQITSQ
jgi:hypothetical protein